MPTKTRNLLETNSWELRWLLDIAYINNCSTPNIENSQARADTRELIPRNWRNPPLSSSSIFIWWRLLHSSCFSSSENKKNLRSLLCCFMMRFFLGFVSCYGSVSRRPEVTACDSPLRSRDESRSVVPVSRSRRRNERGRLGDSAAAGWMPSLGSISEDDVLPSRNNSRNGPVGSGRKVRRRSGTTETKVHNRDYTDDYG